MKTIAGLCLILLVAGIVSGWFLMGGIVGSILGIILASVVVIPFYCLASVFVKNSTALQSSLENTHSSPKLDSSQLSKSAYETRAVK